MNRRRLAVNAALVALTLALFAVIGSATGRITVRGGYGWDGDDYADMLEDGWTEGTPNTALRPLVVVMNWPVYRLTRDAIATFRAMNYVYVALLCLAICLLFDRYSDDAAAKALLVVNVMLSIATLKYAAYYPMLIDPGAHAILVLATYLVVAGKRIPAAVACVVAVFAREFAIGVLAFGIARDLRLRVPLLKVLLTYGPGVATFVGWRMFVAWSFPGEESVGLRRMIENIDLWTDPVFVAFFVYFLVTVFGGVSLLLFARLDLVWRHVRREPEWAVYAAAILAPAILGSADIWRYLAYLLPPVLVLFAVSAREVGVPRRLAITGLMCAATVLTQRPLAAMDVTRYFKDWFPYYVQLMRVPPEGGNPVLLPAWGGRFLIAASLVWLAAVISLRIRVRSD